MNTDMDITEHPRDWEIPGPSNLLSLPYDIRYKIYEHLFPAGNQIYIQVVNQGRALKSITPNQGLPYGLLLSCSALNAEASDYLYNTYLFNIIGRKQHCLQAYKDFLATVRKHARNEVQINAFSNGSHSSTMCLSIHSGEGRSAMLRRRERGEPKAIDDLEKEVAAKAASRRWRWVDALPRAQSFAHRRQAVAVLIGLVVLLFAWWTR